MGRWLVLLDRGEAMTLIAPARFTESTVSLLGRRDIYYIQYGVGLGPAPPAAAAGSNTTPYQASRAGREEKVLAIGGNYHRGHNYSPITILISLNGRV